MTESNKELIARIESCLVIRLRPHFLLIHEDNGFIIIVVARSEYEFVNIPNRIHRIYNLLELDIPDIIKHKVLIQAYDSKEITDYLEHLF